MNRAPWVAHFGLDRTPFGKSIAAKDLFIRQAHQEAVARINFCIVESAIGVVTGDVGAGTFRREVEAARGVARDTGLDEVLPSHGHTPERTRNLRWIYVHMIEEYARHNGHADLIRECIDGAVGD